MKSLPLDMPNTGYLAHYLVFVGVWLLLVGALWWFFRILSKERRSLIVGNLLVFLTLGWTALTLGETYYRYVYDATDWHGVTVTTQIWLRRHGTINRDHFRDLPMGTLDGQVLPKPPNTERIGCIGDSFTYGFGVHNFRETYPKLLEPLGEARGLRVQGWNFGVIGTNTGHHLGTLESVLPTGDLDRVVLGYCLNDIEDLQPHNQLPLRTPEDIKQIPVLMPWHSFLLDTLWYRLHLRRDKRVTGYLDLVRRAHADPGMWEFQAERFREFVALCKLRGLRPTVMVFPMFQVWGPEYPFHPEHERVIEEWRRVGADVMDLRDLYAPYTASELMINRNDGHPSELAHRLAAEALLDHLYPPRR